MIADTHSPVLRLREGKVYPFRITGTIELPDGSKYFILSDPNLVKHLLSQKYYENYYFEPGQLIDCRVDKINCNGKIYIEPLHPFYRLGKKYDFPFVRFSMHRPKNGTTESFAVFEDIFGNEVKIPWDTNYCGLSGSQTDLKAGDTMKLTVVRIKMGQIYVSDTDFDGDFKSFKSGEEYPFTITGYRNYPGKQGYFILQSEKGSQYKLRNKFYEKYGLSIGRSILCRVIREGKDTFLEPKHPFYQIGSEYNFNITGMDTIREYPEGQSSAYVLKNEYGKDILVAVGNVSKDHPDASMITCKVIDIRKGRVIVDCF